MKIDVLESSRQLIRTSGLVGIGKISNLKTKNGSRILYSTAQLGDGKACISYGQVQYLCII